MYTVWTVVLFLLEITCESSYADTKYIVSTDKENWVQAFINCKNYGMELVSIKTQTDEDNLESFLIHNGYYGLERYFTSGTNLGDDTYYWASTGSLIEYSNWLSGEPNNDTTSCNTGEHCIEVGVHDDKFGWNDKDCTTKLKYICEQNEQ